MFILLIAEVFNNCWLSGNSADLFDQTSHSVVSDLGLHCLLRPVCQKTEGKYGRQKSRTTFLR